MKDRLGFSFLYFAPRITDAHDRWFGRLRAHGYACAELPIVDATEAELAAMRRACEREGLARTAVGFAVPGANPVSADPVEREAAVARDYPIVFGTLFIFGLIGLLVGIISDLMYVLVDPRIDFERREG